MRVNGLDLRVAARAATCTTQPSRTAVPVPHPHRAHGALRSRIILLAPVLACARGQLLSPARHPAGGVQAGGRHEIAPDGREQLVELLGEQRVAKQPRRRAHLCGEEGAVVSTCMQPPRRPPPRRAAARTPLCTAPRFSRGCAPRRPRIDLCAGTPPVGREGAVVSTCMQLRSVCWHATSKLAPLAQWRPFNQPQASAIKRNQGRSHLEARAARPMERGAHERRVERRAHVLVRRRLEHSRLDLKRHKAPSVVISRHQWPISGDQRRSAAISGQLAAIEGHQRSSAVIRGHQEGHQRSSEVIRRPSSVIIGQLAVTNGPSTAIAPVR